MIDESTLRKMYLEEELSMKEIAKRLDVAVGTVFNYLGKYGIKGRRHLTESARKAISERKKGKPGYWKGKHFPEEIKRKISESRKGKYIIHSKYGGHIKKRTDGYNMVYIPSHPHASKEGYVMEHILVMEEALGRYIREDEEVHHINHIRDDNRPENLQVMTKKEHASYHLKERHRNHQINYRKQAVRNITTGETFVSCKEAAKKYGVAPTNISRACKESYRTVKGCKWEHVKEEENGK